MNHFHLKANRENHFFFRQFISFMAIFLSLVCVVVPCINTFLPLFHTFSYWYVSFIYFTLNIIVICPLSGSSMIYHIKTVNDNWQQSNSETCLFNLLLCIVWSTWTHFVLPKCVLDSLKDLCHWCLIVKGNRSSWILFLFLNYNHRLCHLIQRPHMLYLLGHYQVFECHGDERYLEADL